MLFCRLTKDQRELYRAYLSSQEVDDILEVGQASNHPCIRNWLMSPPCITSMPMMSLEGPAWPEREGTVENACQAPVSE